MLALSLDKLSDVGLQHSLKTSLNIQGHSLNDVDDSFIELELTSERGKASSNPKAIIHDEEFCTMIYLIQCVQEGSTKHFSLCLVSEVNICVDTARTWLHHLVNVIIKKEFILVMSERMQPHTDKNF